MLMIYANEVFLVLKHLKFVLLNTKRIYLHKNKMSECRCEINFQKLSNFN